MTLCIACGGPAGAHLQCPECQAERDFARQFSVPASGAKAKVTAPKPAPKPRTMTYTEQRMAQMLDADPAVAEWWHDAVRLQYGRSRAWYKPDFFIRWTDGVLEFREVKRKGHWRTAQKDTRVRFESCAQQYRMFRWTWYEWDSKAKCWAMKQRYDSTSEAA